MSKVSAKLVKAVKQLGKVFTSLGEQLEEMNKACIASGRIPDAMVDVLYHGSKELLSSAKSFAALGGEATVGLGVSASAMEESAWAMEREAWWKVAEDFTELDSQFTGLNKGFRKESALVNTCNPDSIVPKLILSAGGDLGAAGHVFAVAAGELLNERVTQGLQHVFSAGELFVSVGNSLISTSEELDNLAVGPWSDDCTCGTFKWVSEGWIDKTWVLYECVKDVGTFCSVCIWQETARTVRFHSRKPSTPEPRED